MFGVWEWMEKNYLNLHELVIYRQILNDEIVKKVQALIEMIYEQTEYQKIELENCYYEIYYKLVQKAEREKMSGHLWKNYLLMLLLEDENVFSLACEKEGESVSKSLYDLAMDDMNILKNFYELDWTSIEKAIGVGKRSLNDTFQIHLDTNDFHKQYIRKIVGLQQALSETVLVEAFVKHLIEYYHTAGCGKMGKYAAFRWDKTLIGIEEPDSVKLEDLIGYANQKEILIRNTEAFVKGKKANNVLLYGDKGTGKSSSVKALLSKYAHEGLRMIEISKNQLIDFPKIIQRVKNRGQRFIIFMDDLSFEDFETEYKHIKGIIEGSLEVKPDNVLIYVTSNRRHLIKENWSDQRNLGDEIHKADAMQEKLSLADRFGITITYLSPNQELYLKIVEELAQKNRINLSKEVLRERAIQWEMRYHGRSGRTAQQFINHLLGNEENLG